MEYNVIIEKDEEGWFVARVPEIQGCHTQGKTIQEVLERIKSTPDEKSVPRSALFWENYENAKIVEQKTQFSSQMAIETKSFNNLNTLLQNIEKFRDWAKSERLSFWS